MKGSFQRYSDQTTRAKLFSTILVASVIAGLAYRGMAEETPDVTAPESYLLACIAGDAGAGLSDALPALTGLLDAYEELDVDVLVLLEPLPGAEATAYDALQELLANYALTVFLVTAQREAHDHAHEAIHGVSVPAIQRFGPDGFQFFDSIDIDKLGGESLGNRSGILHQHRRAIKDARWSIGFTPRISPALPMRDQLSLFVDDPLDYLLVGQVLGMDIPVGHFGELPWGATSFGLITPIIAENAPEAQYVWYVNAQGVAPISLERLREMREAEAAQTAEEEVQEASPDNADLPEAQEAE